MLVVLGFAPAQTKPVEFGVVILYQMDLLAIVQTEHILPKILRVAVLVVRALPQELMGVHLLQQVLIFLGVPAAIL